MGSPSGLYNRPFLYMVWHKVRGCYDTLVIRPDPLSTTWPLTSTLWFPLRIILWSLLPPLIPWTAESPDVSAKSNTAPVAQAWLYIVKVFGFFSFFCFACCCWSFLGLGCCSFLLSLFLVGCSCVRVSFLIINENKLFSLFFLENDRAQVYPSLLLKALLQNNTFKSLLSKYYFTLLSQ